MFSGLHPKADVHARLKRVRRDAQRILVDAPACRDHCDLSSAAPQATVVPNATIANTTSDVFSTRARSLIDCASGGV